MPKELLIHFGSVAGPLRVQLRGQGVRLSPSQTRWFQRDMDAVDVLQRSGLISPKQADKIAEKIMDRIVEAVREYPDWVGPT